MKYAVGYQLAEAGEEPFSRIVEAYSDHIAEMYFPWLDMPTGRSALSVRRGFTDWSAQRRLEEELSAVRALGIKLDILFNANCYGDAALSKSLANKILSVLDYLENAMGGVHIVTTTSPAIAHTVKKHFPGLEVRASVNMRIGTVKGMQYVADLFDSFYVQREYNRDMAHIRALRAWADENGKNLMLLANSGCMNFCSGQTFHDNLVAHEAGVGETTNIEGFLPHICWRYLRDRKNWVSVLQNSWVRPEDVYRYEGLIETMKLATRMHALPGMVLEAYTSESYFGNLLDLCEPGFGPAFAPYVIDNKLLPDDWFDRVSTCDRQCHQCGFCKDALAKALVCVEADT